MSSVYIHIPFCEKKCLYCDFYSIENHSAFDRFLNSLRREVGLYAKFGNRSAFETVFFGGGTPSLLTPHQLESINDRLRSTFNITIDAEVTLETNPGTVSGAKLRAYRALGINRLSIGIQSFHENELLFLGRIHTREEAIKCVELARQAGFENINVDLIFSLPGQDLKQWEKNLQQAVALDPAHISAYSLIVEDHTPLARMVNAGQVSPSSVEVEAEMYEFTMSFLEERGFEHYEVSNYARPGYRSRHNTNYWNHSNYLGFGPSAHSFWRNPSDSSGHRWWNIANISHYCDRLADDRLPIVSEEEIGSRDLVTERIFLGLRSDGVSLSALRSDFGVDLLHHQHEIIKGLVDEHLVIVEDHTLRLTQKGYLLCDEICARLML